MSLGKQITDLRKVNDLKKTELARKMEVSRNTIYNVEQDDNCGSDLLIRIFDHFGYELVAIPKRC